MMDSQTFSVLRAVFAALALTVLGTAAANEGASAAEAASADATAISSKQGEPKDSWFNLEALELNVYGLSYHPDREIVHRKNLGNQVNPGLAIHYELVNDARGITFAELGEYRDSGRNSAKFAALGYQWKFGEDWRIGGALAAMNSKTYNRGVTFLGMIPLVTYDLGFVQLNGVYFPKFGRYNEVDAFGFYITLPVGKWAR